MSLEFKSREVHINAIRIPWDTLPGADKIAKCYGFYKEHGFLDRVIVIDGQYWLRDGLAGLMVARAVGLKRVRVLQVTEKKDKPEPKTDVKPGVKTEDKPETKSTTPPGLPISERGGERHQAPGSLCGVLQRYDVGPDPGQGIQV